MAKTTESTCSDNLLERLKGGDDVAFGELVNSHWDKIYNRANSLLDNRQDAEEVALTCARNTAALLGFPSP